MIFFSTAQALRSECSTSRLAGPGCVTLFEILNQTRSRSRSVYSNRNAFAFEFRHLQLGNRTYVGNPNCLNTEPVQNLDIHCVSMLAQTFQNKTSVKGPTEIQKKGRDRVELYVNSNKNKL